MGSLIDNNQATPQKVVQHYQATPPLVPPCSSSPLPCAQLWKQPHLPGCAVVTQLPAPPVAPVVITLIMLYAPDPKSR